MNDSKSEYCTISIIRKFVLFLPCYFSSTGVILRYGLQKAVKNFIITKEKSRVMYAEATMPIKYKCL